MTSKVKRRAVGEGVHAPVTEVTLCDFPLEALVHRTVSPGSMVRLVGEKKLLPMVTMCIVRAETMGEISNATINITACNLILNFFMFMERFYTLFRTQVVR